LNQSHLHVGCLLKFDYPEEVDRNDHGYYTGTQRGILEEPKTLIIWLINSVLVFGDRKG